MLGVVAAGAAEVSVLWSTQLLKQRLQST